MRVSMICERRHLKWSTYVSRTLLLFARVWGRNECWSKAIAISILYIPSPQNRMEIPISLQFGYFSLGWLNDTQPPTGTDITNGNFVMLRQTRMKTLLGYGPTWHYRATIYWTFVRLNPRNKHYTDTFALRGLMDSKTWCKPMTHRHP